MINTSMKIQSNFSDYYDSLSDKNSDAVYNRIRNASMQRGRELEYLRSIGIRTVELKQVKNFTYMDKKLVVYTDPSKHDGIGKKICDHEEAKTMYENYLASKFYEETNGITIKYLKVGSRGFTLYFKKDTESLELGRLTDIVQSDREYNRLIGIPIFSIDYINTGKEMLATDFNDVENLGKLGINNYVSDTEVIDEIYNSLIIYNKI